MMNFEILQQSIIDNILVPAESGRFITIGYQRQRRSAENINANRQVAVYYSEGSIPKSAGKAYGDVQHEVSFLVELAVSTAAEIDLATLNDGNATENEKAVVLRQMQEAGMIADRQMNDLIRTVFQILMDVRNDQMGMIPPEDRPNLRIVADRWVDQIKKDTPSQDGEFFILTGAMRLTCSIEESVTGDDLSNAVVGSVFDVDIDLDGDDVEKTGVEVTTP